MLLTFGTSWSPNRRLQLYGFHYTKLRVQDTITIAPFLPPHDTTSAPLPASKRTARSSETSVSLLLHEVDCHIVEQTAVACLEAANAACGT